MKRLAEKYFSAISSAPLPPPVGHDEPKQTEERRVVLTDKAQPVVIVGWHIPAVSDPRYAAVKAAADLLGGGHYSRLYKALVKEQKLAVEAEMVTGQPGEKYPSLDMLFLVPAPGQDPEKVEQAAYAVIDQALTTQPFTAEELDGYKVRIRAEKIVAAEDNGQLAGELAQAQALHGGWHDFFREQERVQGLTTADLTGIVRDMLVKENRTVALIKNPPAAANEGGR